MRHTPSRSTPRPSARLALGAASALLAVVAVGAQACGGSKPPQTPAEPSAVTETEAKAPSEEIDKGTTSTTTEGLAADAGPGTKLEPTGGPGKPSHDPGRSVKDIQTKVATHRDEARACYDEGLKKHPGIEGDLVVKWVIDPDGNVVDPEVDTSKSSILEPGVGKCVVGVIKKLTFPKSEKGFETRANYPFNFHPRTLGRDAGT